MNELQNRSTEDLTNRLEEIRGMADDESRSTEELEQLAQEREAIDTELNNRRAAAARDVMRREAVAGNTAGVRTVENMASTRSQNEAEARARRFVETRHTEVPVAELRATLISSDTLATPTGVSGINDLPGNRVSSILDLVNVVNCSGMGANKVAYVKEDPEEAGAQTEGEAAAEKEPDFDYVTITPTSIAAYSQISKQAKKQSPLSYETKVKNLAVLSLRKKAVGLIVTALKASSLVDEVVATVDGSTHKGVIDETTLRKIVLAYGGDEDVVGGAVLFLKKADLTAFGDVRGTNEKKAVYEITPDMDNPNMGIIKDGGLSVRYCIVSGLTAAAGTSQGAAKVKTMFYGDPKCFELDLFSDYEVVVSSDFAITSLMETIVGDAEIGGDVVVNKGFVAYTLPTNP